MKVSACRTASLPVLAGTVSVAGAAVIQPGEVRTWAGTIGAVDPGGNALVTGPVKH